MGEHHRRRPVTETQTNGDDTVMFGDSRISPVLYKTMMKIYFQQVELIFLRPDVKYKLAG